MMYRKHLAVSLAVAFGVLVLLLVFCFRESDKSEQLVEDTYAVVEHLKSLDLSVENVESGVRGFINTGQSVFINGTFKSESEADYILDHLIILLADDGQQVRLARLKRLVKQKFEWEQALIAAVRADGRSAAASLSRTMQGTSLMKQVHDLTREMIGSQNMLLQRYRQRYHLYQGLLIAIGAGLTLLGTAGVWLAVKSTRLSMRLEAQQVLSYERLELLNRELNNQVFDLLQAQDDAKRALQVRSEFLNKISHELRTPLAGVIGATDLALGMPMLEEQRRLVTTAKNCGDQLLALVTDILDFESMELHQLKLSESEFDVRLSVQAALEPLIARARSKGVEFDLMIADQVPYVVLADRVRLQQVLVNLVDNAVKFTESGLVKVRVSVDARRAGSAMVRFTVEDTGIGIKPEQCERIFEPFAQVDSSSSRRHGGTGLGLAICKRLVELLTGKIEMESEPGKGSRFSFVVPLMSVADAALSLQRAELEPRRTATDRTVILLVEDSDALSLVTGAQLRRLGFDYDSVSTAEEALAAIKVRKYGLVLMDLELPGLDGVEATRVIRAMDDLEEIRSIAIVALTAHSLSGERAECLAAGMNDYLVKPVALSTLRAVIDKWVPAGRNDGRQLA